MALESLSDCPGSPVVTASPSSVGRCGSGAGSQGATIPHSLWPKHQNIKQKQYCKKFNKDFKNSLYQDRSLKRRESVSSTSQMPGSVLDTFNNCNKTGTVIVAFYR